MKLNLRGIDLNLLPVFTAVVEEGNLSRAASRLGMSQPAISAALQRLRLTVRDDLFVRSRQGLLPTPHAQLLYQQVSGGLQQLVEALDPEQRFDPAQSSRVFRLVAVDYFEAVMLGGLINRLRAQSTSLGLQVVPQQEGWLRQLLAADVDMALDIQRPDDDRIVGDKVGEERMVVVARQGHPAIRGALALEDFLQSEHVVLPYRERQTLPLDVILGRPGWRRRVGAQVGQYGSLLAVASQTDLIATVPRHLAAAYAGRLQLQVLDFPVPVAGVPLHLLWPRVLDRDPAHRWFRGLVRESFRFLGGEA